MKRKKYVLMGCMIKFGVLAVLISFITAGCATVKGSLHLDEMGLNKDTESLDTTQESICLVSLKTENQWKPDHTPKVNIIRVVSEETGKEYKFTPVAGGLNKMISMTLKDAFKPDRNSGPVEYLLSLKLPPGSYRISSISGMSVSPLLRCNFNFPFDTSFSVYSDEVVYLGRIEMSNRQKTSDDELPSGSKFPLIDQVVCGFSGGTFVVKIYDNFDKDLIMFQKEYPVISHKEIGKRVMPSWKRPDHES